jgi:sugar phosphate isomerase/epimerase
MTIHTIISGFTDEVSDDLDLQIKALKTLGWNYIDLRSVNGKNVSSLSDKEFDQVHQRLKENNIEIACFGSTIANWGRIAQDSFDLDMAEMRNSIRHMKKAGVRFIRIMSYKIDTPVELGSELEPVIISNIKQIVELAEDNGIVCLHENCVTWGGQSCHHSLRLLEQVNSPALKLVFDTGNPVSMSYIDGSQPYGSQDALKFFEAVREHVAYLHIKDARLVNGSVSYTFPGEGQGRVRAILELVSKHEMAIPISIEPHVAVVFHDPSVKAPLDERWDTFIEYGRRLVAMAEEAGINFSRTGSH